MHHGATLEGFQRAQDRADGHGVGRGGHVLMLHRGQCATQAGRRVERCAPSDGIADDLPDVLQGTVRSLDRAACFQFARYRQNLGRSDGRCPLRMLGP